MAVRPHSQNPWQLASPRSSVAAGGRGALAVEVDKSGVLVPAALRSRQLIHENIMGLHSNLQGESAVPHKCLHSSATSSCRMFTSPPVLHDRVCSTVILAPQPSQAAGISSGEWLYLYHIHWANTLHWKKTCPNLLVKWTKEAYTSKQQKCPSTVSCFSTHYNTQTIESSLYLFLFAIGVPLVRIGSPDQYLLLYLQHEYCCQGWSI